MQHKMLVVGLGNVGSMYDNTRHNVGFGVVDKLADILGEKFSNKRALHASLVQYTNTKGTLIIAKPSRYMNNSGEVVAALCKWYQLPTQNCVVVTDNIDLVLGDLRLKNGIKTDDKKRSSNTHNGIRSVVEHLGTTHFMRLYLGIGGAFRKHGEDLASYVLKRWAVSERATYEGMCEVAAQVLQHVLSDDFQTLCSMLAALKKEIVLEK